MPRKTISNEAATEKVTASVDSSTESVSNLSTVPNIDVESTTAPKSEAAVKNEVSDTESTISKIVASIDDIAGPAAVTSAPSHKTISRDREVLCRSICFGGLVYRSEKSGAKFRWPSMGSIETMTFGELLEMHNNKRSFLEKPYLIVDDPDVVRYFRLDEIYRKVARIDELQDVLKEDRSSIDEVLTTILQVGMRDVAISKLRHMRKIGTLTNIDVIYYLEKKLKFDFSDDDNAE